MDSWWPNGIFFPSVRIGNLGLPAPEPPTNFQPRGSPRSSPSGIIRIRLPRSIVLARYLLGRIPPAPLLRDALRLILGINVGFNDATRWTRMVRRGSPRTIQQFHGPQLFQCDAAPVLKRTRWFPNLSLSRRIDSRVRVTGKPDCGLTCRGQNSRGDSCTSCSRVVCLAAAVNQTIDLFYCLNLGFDDTLIPTVPWRSKLNQFSSL